MPEDDRLEQASHALNAIDNFLTISRKVLITRARQAISNSAEAAREFVESLSIPKSPAPQVTPIKCDHKHYDWECPCCLAQWDAAWKPLIENETK